MMYIHVNRVNGLLSGFSPRRAVVAEVEVEGRGFWGESASPPLTHPFTSISREGLSFAVADVVDDILTRSWSKGTRQSE